MQDSLSLAGWAAGSSGDANSIRPQRQSGAIKGQSDSAKSPLTWQHIVNAVRHEMFPVMSARLMECVVSVALSDADLSEEAVKRVLGQLKKRSNRAVQYIRGLVARARAFSWDAQPQMS